MTIRQNSTRRIEWERSFERLSPTKIQLIRANPLTCPNCIAAGSVITTDSTCNGTGYTGMPRITATDGSQWLASPASSLYIIYGDIQTGKGLYGASSEFIKLDPNFGKLDVGDAMLFTKFQDTDRRTGIRIHPDVNSSFVRPDHIIDRFGNIYNVTKELSGNLGDDVIFRAYTLLKGFQGTNS